MAETIDGDKLGGERPARKGVKRCALAPRGRGKKGGET